MRLTKAQAKAKVLTEALPYIRQWSGKRVLVKAGGETMDRAGMLDSLARDLALMRFVGLRWWVFRRGRGGENSHENSNCSGRSGLG